MDKAKEEARRVFDHCKEFLQLPDDFLRDNYGLSVDRIADNIRNSTGPKMDEKYVADTIIKLFDIQWKNLKE